jgi:hypothetical protein
MASFGEYYAFCAHYLRSLADCRSCLMHLWMMTAIPTRISITDQRVSIELFEPLNVDDQEVTQFEYNGKQFGQVEYYNCYVRWEIKKGDQ